jgi:DNA-binding transcriptional regulator GbsR (MarR family)
MSTQEAKDKFIKSWGAIGTKWGINKTMAQIHGLLLISADPLCTEDIMEQLNISRGNANMNIRALIDWDIISKEPIIGERKEYFVAEKDLWQISQRVLMERKKRELEPIKKLAGELHHIRGGKGDKDTKELSVMAKKLASFSDKADKSLERVLKANEHWFFGSFMKLMN